APLVAYAIFGSSRTMAVGPVAVASLMSAAAAGQFAQGDVNLFYEASVVLALIGGVCLLGLGLLKAGFVANLLSHPVIGGFITASALLIALGQVGPLLGFSAKGDTFLDTAIQVVQSIALTHPATALIGLATLVWLWVTKRYGKGLLAQFGLSGLWLEITFRAAPLLAIVVGILCVRYFALAEVTTVGHIPASLPNVFIPSLSSEHWLALLVPGLLIALVGFVETVSVGHTLAAKRKQKINPDQELLGLGAANVASGLFGGYSVTGGFSRSVVNFDAGAQTPMAGVFTAGGIVLATLFLTPLLYHLPHATLAATIIVAVLGLIEPHLPGVLWRYSKRDFLAYVLTLLVVLIVGIEAGILAGVAFSVLALLAAISKPHWAIIGQVPGTEHFRNEKRHRVQTYEDVVSLRVDESLFFPNARWLEDTLLQVASQHPNARALVLQCSAINHIDASAVEALEQIDDNLRAMGVDFFLSEVKGPVQDQLKTTRWYQSIEQRIGLTHLETLNLAHGHLEQNRQNEQEAR
ncbi:MAG: SulP family inorganic anion transporter, partial [Limnobacter sp.]|nr:SulP family inorganic anion transporter [Limnobacter sp.]